MPSTFRTRAEAGVNVSSQWESSGGYRACSQGLIELPIVTVNIAVEPDIAVRGRYRGGVEDDHR
jgi:hypothetical protein